MWWCSTKPASLGFGDEMNPTADGVMIPHLRYSEELPNRWKGCVRPDEFPSRNEKKSEILGVKCHLERGTSSSDQKGWCWLEVVFVILCVRVQLGVYRLIEWCSGAAFLCPLDAFSRTPVDCCWSLAARGNWVVMLWLDNYYCHYGVHCIGGKPPMNVGNQVE